MTGAVRTTCPYCGVGCGVIASRDGAGHWQVRGDEQHPANLGRLCSKGSALAETLVPEGRLLFPEIDGKRVGWGEAIATVAGRLKATIDVHGPNSVAFYVSGQLLTEDYYVANKLMKGFIGSSNIDTNSRLCMASTVAGHKRAFGSDTVPGLYVDLELADLVVLVGSNLAWCHPVLFQRLRAAREKRGTRIVVIDPRRTDSCDIADLHLALRPGGDVALFNGLLLHLSETGQLAPDFIRNKTKGFEEALTAARTGEAEAGALARQLGLAEADLRKFFNLFAETERVVTVFSQGVNQSDTGTDKVNAIINCHLATGRIGREGMGPFSVTGQPNAMGGREVGGLANQLAAHMGFSNADRDRVARFWGVPAVAEGEGLKAVEMFEAVADGRIKALWVMATNPAVSLPQADAVQAALEACPLVILSDCIGATDTGHYAHIRLPASGWGEKDGTVTNSERTISRQRAFLPALGEARPDWWIISCVAASMGHAAAFSYRGPADIFREHAALSAFENDGSRDFDIGAAAGLDDAAYDAAAPFRWPWVAGAAPAGRLFGGGRFFTADGRANFVATAARSPRSRVSREFPLLLNTGRYRDQWHTMTRTGLAARLTAHRSEPLLEINPADADARGLADGSLAEVENAGGRYVARVRVTGAQQAGHVFLPMHWSNAFAACAVAGALIPPVVDPVSGQPALKLAAVQVRPLAAAWHGVLISAAPVEFSGLPYWARRRARGGHLAELAGLAMSDADALISRLDITLEGERIDYRDTARGSVRHAWFAGGRLVAALFVSPQPLRIDRSWLEALAAEEELDGAARTSLLAGRAGAGRPATGRIVCSCFQVGFDSIVAAIRTGRLASPAEIGAALKAGTNCGSCIPELKEILAHEHAASLAGTPGPRTVEPADNAA